MRQHNEKPGEQMDQSDLKKLRKALLIISDEVKRICEKNEIKYSLIGGSLLGAVRHRGFIPWDDDMDIGMLRNEYDKFLKICDKELDARFILQTNINDPYYGYGFSKILLKGSVLVELGHEKTKYKKGIFVDIFPYDNVPINNFQVICQKSENYLLKEILRQKMKIADAPQWGCKEKFIIRIIDLIKNFCKKEDLVYFLNRNMTRYNHENTERISSMSGYYGYDRECVPASIFRDFILVDFEGHKYSAIKDYDEFLRIYYGDYMKLPPVEERRTHGFTKLDFGIYEKTL